MEPTSFLKACNAGDLEGVRQYVAKEHKTPFVTDEFGRTGLFYAIWGNRPTVVSYLLEIAPCIECMPSRAGSYPQTIAIATQRQEIVALFLEVMSATDFEGKIQQLTSPPGGCMIQARLHPSDVAKLKKIYETPEFKAKSESYRTHDIVRERIAKQQNIAASSVKPKHEPKSEIETSDLISLFEHCVISKKVST